MYTRIILKSFLRKGGVTELLLPVSPEKSAQVFLHLFGYEPANVGLSGIAAWHGLYQTLDDVKIGYSLDSCATTDELKARLSYGEHLICLIDWNEVE